MALKGSVEALSLVEVFEIIHSSSRSGTLKVGADRSTRVLRFHRGLLYYQHRPKDSVYKIGKLLLRQGLLTRAALENAVAIQKTRGGRLGEVLVAEGAVGEDEILRVLALQYKEEVYDVFLWERAQFEFEKDALPEGFSDDVAAGRALALNPAQLVMEAVNRIDEWKRIHRVIPSQKLVCVEARGRAQEVAALLEARRIDARTVTFDGQRTLAQVFEVWQHTYFGSHRIVFELLEAGLIRPLTVPELRLEIADSLERGDFRKALRFYESALECPEGLDLERELNDLVFGEGGIRRASEPLSFEARTSGKKALFLLMALYEDDARGRLAISEGGDVRAVTFSKDALGVETLGESSTPDVIRYAARRGFLSEKEAEEARRRRDEQDLSSQEILMKSGKISASDWNALLVDKLIDEIADVFFWRESQIEFKNHVVSPWSEGPANLRLEIPYSVAGFASELRRSLARLRQYLDEIPSMRTIFVRTEKRSRRARDLALFDGRRTLRDILTVMSLSRQDFIRFVHRALEEGEIRPLGRDEYKEEVELAEAEGRFEDAQALASSAIDAGLDPDFFRRKRDKAHVADEELQPSLLEGDCDTVSLAEVLESLHRRRRSGTLEVLEGERKRTVHVKDGEIHVLRKEERADCDDLFLESAAVEAVRQTFGGDLIARGLVSEDEISEALATEIKEGIWDMFIWEGARFVLRRNVLPRELTDPAGGAMRVVLKTEAFLIEAIRRIQQWEELRGRIPEDGVVFRFVSPELKMQAIAGSSTPELLYLIDGRRSLGEVLRVSGANRTDVYALAAGLEADGAIVRVADEQPSGA